MKFLVLLLVLGVAYMVWRGKRVESRKAPRQSAQLPAPQEMLACARCGVHVPRSDAWLSDGRSYCCAEHQKQDGH
ncbi:PP0621 family protein [Simplicispira hankyongi]|jgi:uncharacterized protein|uniref:MYND finger n=1 Tax=Simplicispira hankyongi TaxID=2315688 RepID=A0A398CBN3_9BURK|nr:PP0621 family protein [Simplicispira hankyongi]RID98338.1 hypothetical protein D3F03_08825 [Simplicispira hankyongi]